MAASLCLFILVKMAASLASIAETWPENVLTSIASRKLLSQKIIARPNFVFLLSTDLTVFFVRPSRNPFNLMNP